MPEQNSSALLIFHTSIPPFHHPQSTESRHTYHFAAYIVSRCLQTPTAYTEMDDTVQEREVIGTVRNQAYGHVGGGGKGQRW